MDEKEYGIKYKVFKITDEKYFLVPVCLIVGTSDAFTFTPENELEKPLSICNYAKDLKNKFVADRVFFLDELDTMYDYDRAEDDKDEDFVPNYFFDSFKDTLIYIETDGKNDDVLKKNEINIRDFTEREFDLTYFLDKKTPLVALNSTALDELSNCKDDHDLQVILSKYKLQLEKFRESYEKMGITKVNLTNDKIISIESNKKYLKGKGENPEKTDKPKKKDDDFSYVGLCKYIKERVFGHDDQIDTIAKILYLNRKASKEDGVESFLITGPTGTGKTETIKAASEYLHIPYMEVNAANIVPQGIKGMSIEDVLSNLYMRSDYKLEDAERGLVFLDEFDKLNDTDLEIKGVVKNILLTFIQGGTFPIDNDQFSISFDTSMLSKGFAGVFDKIRDDKSNIGFGAQEEHKEKVKKILEKGLSLRDKIIEKEYFTQEELSRINTILAYGDLDRETRRRILLYSKLSELQKKKNRYKRDYDIDIIAEESFINAILDEVNKKNQGMRVVNNLIKDSIDPAEKEILRNEDKGYKKLILTKKTVINPKDFDIS